MNLKESFRYQKFLEALMTQSQVNLTTVSHCLMTEKHHMRSVVNPDASDEVELVDDGEFVGNDTVMKFMWHLVDERTKLSKAIGEAKAGIGFDLDAAVESNKFRQNVHSAIRNMLRYVPTKQKRQERGYKFDINGVQQAYLYDVEVMTTERYNKEEAKRLMRTMIQEADKVSSEVDAALINTEVQYVPPYDVNDSYDDCIEAFVNNMVNC